MYCLNFENNCSILECLQEEKITGRLISIIHRTDSSYLIIDTLNNQANNSISIDTFEIKNHIQLKNLNLLKVPSRVGKLLANAEDQQSWEAFVNQSLSAFHGEMSNAFRCLISRLKSKKIGDTTLLDIENVSLSVADYHRFMYQLQMASESLPETLTPLAERTLAASNIISNLQGGISILAGGSVEQHLQYALLLKDLEQWR